MSRIRRAVPVIAVAAVLAVVSACSSSGGGATTPSGGGSTSGGASTGSTASGGGSAAAGTAIKVGVICSCTSALGAGAAGVQKATDAWAKDVNANGGISGHRVELTFKDSKNDPATAASVAKDLIRAGVAVIIDSDTAASAWAKDVDAAKIPVIGGDLSSQNFITDPNFYPIGMTTDNSAFADVKIAKDAGAKKFGYLYCAEAPTCQDGVKPHNDAGEKLGLPVQYSAAIAASAPNYTAQCLAAKQRGLDAFFVGHSGQVLARVATDCAKQDYHPQWLEQGAGFYPGLAETPALEGMLLNFPTAPATGATGPHIDRMKAALDKYAPGLFEDKQNFTAFVPQSWIAGVGIEKAVELSGAAAGDEITADVIRKGLDSFKDETVGGWTGPITFEAGKVHNNKCWFTGKIEGGKLTVANDGKATCRE